ncbi:MAG: hypothetical protein ACYDAR_02465 [Thermomicrobiales bacterium]
MHVFVPYFDATSGERALHEARRITRPGDRVTVMAPVIVPGGLPVDVGAGAIWKQSCQAEQRLFHAREAAERILPGTVALRFVRVQARDRATAIRTGALHYGADLILLDVPEGVRGALSLRFGAIAAVIRQPPCTVRFVGTLTEPESLSSPETPRVVTPFPTLRTIAVNPALASSGGGDRARRTEEQRAP